MTTELTHHQIEANGITLHAVTAGAGPAVVLIHGWPEFWYSWRETIPALAARYRVIAPDLRGSGESDKPPAGYDKRTLAADVAALLTALGHERARVVGHDWGGAVAHRLLLDHPERVERLAILNMPYIPGILAGKGPAPSLAQTLESWYQNFHQLPELPEQLVAGREDLYYGHFLRHWTARPETLSAADLARYIENFRRPGNLTGGFNYYRTMYGDDIPQWAADTRRQISTSTLVLWGERDPVLPPSHLDAYPAFFTDLQVRRLPDTGHFPQWEQPTLVNQALLEFLG